MKIIINPYIVGCTGVGILSVCIGLWYYYKTSNNNGDKNRLIKEHGLDRLAYSTSSSLTEMVNLLTDVEVIKDESVKAAMLHVDRAKYVPANTPNPYKEAAIPLGFNATISSPHMHAIGLSLLSDKLQNGARVLDIGSGSGYMSACMAFMVQPLGRVYGVEHVEELVNWSKENIANNNSNLSPIIQIRKGDGFLGLAEHGPYDVIYVGAAAEAIPGELIKQLKRGGRMVIPIGPPGNFHTLTVVDIGADGSVIEKNLHPDSKTVRFVPLTSLDKQIEGENSGPTRLMKDINGQNVLVRPQFMAAPDSTPDEIRKLRQRLESGRFTE